MKLLAFWLALNAWSWACAFTMHEITWTTDWDTCKRDQIPTPQWYDFPVVADMVGVYFGIIIIGIKTKTIDK